MRNEANRPGPNDAELKPRRAKLTQGERLLRHARAGLPLDQADWWSSPPDGLAPIRALRSRIPDLERQGFAFRHVLRPGRLAVYWLIGEPSDHVQPEAEHQVDDDAAEQLALASPSPTPAAAVTHWQADL
jgi:hypothetical protein